MAELNSYKEAREYLDQGKNRKNTIERPLANNTRIEQLDDGTIGIKLHDTYVIKYYSNEGNPKWSGDTIQLDSGGWKTVTTRDRINRFCPLHVWTQQGVMYVSVSNWYEIHNNPDEAKIYHFEDRMFFQPDGTVWKKDVNGTPIQLKPYSKKDEQKKRKQLRAIDTFIRNYVNKLTSGKMDKPGNGDCFYCQGESNPGCTIQFGTLSKEDGYKPTSKPNPDHLLNHIKEKYYVPSLLFSVLRSECYDSEDSVWGNPNMTYGLAQIDKHNISCWFNPNAEHKPFADDLTIRRIKKLMKQYFIKRLGI